ncbi:Cytochrome c oxidase subunit 2 [bacterium HR37]|nr:Cytochrome c oxidase subunit 2 [bacterium HR37]
MKTLVSMIAGTLLFTLLPFGHVLGEELHQKGQEVFQSKGCVACHTIGGGRLVGPDLKGVTQRREEGWLRKWLKDPDTMIQTDPIAKEMLKEYLVPMPNQGLTDEDIDALISYFKHEDNKQNNNKKEE